MIRCLTRPFRCHLDRYKSPPCPFQGTPGTPKIAILLRTSFIFDFCTYYLKMPKITANMSPRGPQEAPYGPQEGHNIAQNGVRRLTGGWPFSAAFFKQPLRPILDPSWAHLGPILGPTWPHLGPIWGSLGLLGPILGPSWPHLGPIWGSLGHLGHSLRPFSPHLGSLGPS